MPLEKTLDRRTMLQLALGAAAGGVPGREVLADPSCELLDWPPFVGQ